VLELEKNGFFPKDERKLGAAFKPQAGMDELGITIQHHVTTHGTHVMDERQPGAFVQTAMLFKRELQSVQRNKVALVARFGLTIFLSVLVGVIFKGVGESRTDDQKNIQSRFGATIMVMLMSMFGTAQPALLAFPDERPVFLREYSTDHYSVIGYFASRFVVEAVVTALQVLVLVCVYFVQFSDITSLPFFVSDLAYLLFDRVPSSFLHVLPHCVRIGHGKYGSCSSPWVHGRGSQVGSGGESV
jgi:ABC-2 type transporter